MAKYTPPKAKPKAVKPSSKSSDFDINDGGYTCTCCGTRYNRCQGNFYLTKSPLFKANNGYVPICRECMCEYYKKYVLPTFDGSEERAVEFICGLLDWRFDEDILAAAHSMMITAYSKSGTDIPVISYYSSRLASRNYHKRPGTYLNTCAERFSAKRLVQSVDEAEVTSDHPDDQRETVSEEDILLFGPGYLPEEYRFMREQYKDWRERYSCETKAQEEIFKNLTIAQVNVRRAQKEGDQKHTNDAMKSLNELMASAKIQPKQKTETALVDQNTFGTLIQKWENEEPIPEPAPEFKDVDNIAKYISTWFYGHLAKMFGLNNDCAQMYEEEIAKYTVEPPSYHADDEGDMNSEVGQMLKAMRGKKEAAEVLDEPEGGESE